MEQYSTLKPTRLYPAHVHASDAFPADSCFHYLIVWMLLDLGTFQTSLLFSRAKSNGRDKTEQLWFCIGVQYR